MEAKLQAATMTLEMLKRKYEEAKELDMELAVRLGINPTRNFMIRKDGRVEYEGDHAALRRNVKPADPKNPGGAVLAATDPAPGQESHDHAKPPAGKPAAKPV